MTQHTNLPWYNSTRQIQEILTLKGPDTQGTTDLVTRLHNDIFSTES